jgi:hypothetical protein
MENAARKKVIVCIRAYYYTYGVAISMDVDIVSLIATLLKKCCCNQLKVTFV